MNILKKFTFKNVKLNKKRSIVTIIGIVLSTALICTVAGMFSSFQKTMVNAIINNPSIILADEPTGNLDSESSEEIVSLLKLSNKKYNQTIIMITHNMEIAKVADRIIKIEDGKIVGEV